MAVSVTTQGEMHAISTAGALCLCMLPASMQMLVQRHPLLLFYSRISPKRIKNG